jgi:3-methyladenine DNA glycosylase AlkD
VEYAEITCRLEQLSNPGSRAGMARFGINTEHAWGVSIPALRGLAREIGRNHVLAQQMWASGVHEMRILAGMVADPELMSRADMDEWAADLDSWDVCDQCCMNLFRKTSFAYEKAAAWSRRDEEFVKRAGFALMAALAVGDKKAPDAPFVFFLTLTEEQAGDGRNFVKKAVNWALRQIGKRNLNLNRQAVKTAQRFRDAPSPAARWVAADALRELTSAPVQNRLELK